MGSFLHYPKSRDLGFRLWGLGLRVWARVEGMVGGRFVLHASTHVAATFRFSPMIVKLTIYL